MATVYGVTDSGFVLKRQADIIAEITASLQSTLGNYINLLPTSVFSQIVGIESEREALLWQLMQDIYNSRIPSSATGVAVDNILALSGLSRLPATYSTVTGQLLFGTVGTLIPAGTKLSVLNNSNSLFSTLSDVTLGAGVSEVQNIAFSGVPASGSWSITFNNLTTSTLAYNASASAVQTAIQALNGLSGVTVTGNYSTGFVLTFGGSSGLQNQPQFTVSSTLATATPTTVIVTVTTTTQGVAQGTVNLQAVNTGPITAPAGTLTVITNPVTGLTSTVNPMDASVGSNVETDAAAKIRRSLSLQIAGAATPSAITSRLLAISGVTNAIVFENTTEITDLSSRPPKSFEAVVYGGAAQTITNTIWATKPAGMRPYGNQTGTLTDSNGTTQTVYWSRPTTVPIYFSLDISKNAALFPANGQQTILNQILAFGNALGIGNSVIIYPQLIAAIQNVPGVTNVAVRIDVNPVSTTPGAAQVNSNIPIASNQISTWDSSRANVNIL